MADDFAATSLVADPLAGPEVTLGVIDAALADAGLRDSITAAASAVKGSAESMWATVARDLATR